MANFLKKLKGVLFPSRELNGTFTSATEQDNSITFKNLDEFCAFVSNYQNFVPKADIATAGKLRPNYIEENIDNVFYKDQKVATAMAEYLIDHTDELITLLSYESVNYNLRDKLAVVLNTISNIEDTKSLNLTIPKEQVIFTEANTLLEKLKKEDATNVQVLNQIVEKLEAWNESVKQLKKTSDKLEAKKKELAHLQEINKNLEDQIEICDTAISNGQNISILNESEPWRIVELKGFDYSSSQAKFIQCFKKIVNKANLLEEPDEKNGDYTFKIKGFEDISRYELLKALAANGDFTSINVGSLEAISNATDFDTLHKVHLFLTKGQASFLSKQYKKTNDGSFEQLNQGGKLKFYDSILEKCTTKDAVSSAEKHAYDKFYIDHCLTKYIVAHVQELKRAFEVVAFKNTKDILEELKTLNIFEIISAQEINSEINSACQEQINGAIALQKSILSTSNNFQIENLKNDFYGIKSTYSKVYQESIFKICASIPISKIDKFSVDVEAFKAFITDTYNKEVPASLQELARSIDRFAATPKTDASLKDIMENLSKNISNDSEDNILNRIEKHNESVESVVTEFNAILTPSEEVITTSNEEAE